MLRFADVNLNLISDVEKYKLVESRISGNIYIVCKSYAKANNKFLKSYDSTNLLHVSYIFVIIIYIYTYIS